MSDDQDNRRALRRAAVALMIALLHPACGAAARAQGLIGVRAVAAAARPSTARASAAHLEASADGAKLSFDLSNGIDATAFVLPDPDRVIVDLPQVDFADDPSVGRPNTDRRGRAKKQGLVTSYRFGLLSPGRSRIVIDLGAPARVVATVHTLGDRSRLTIELARTDRASFRAASRVQASPVVAGFAPKPPAAPGKATIVLDPGHGGPDTGAIVNGVIEKEVALSFAKMLASKLEATGGFNVVMTRASDVFIPLSERVRIARGANAALMISIHADTLPETADVSGATVYTVSDKASDAYAAKVAAKENDADAASGVEGQTDVADVNDILFDLTRQETRAYSHVFARTLVNYWKVAGRLNKNPQRAAGFVVLKAPDVPSVLLEIGYLSSQADSASLTSEDWRDKATGRMAEAIEDYFSDHNGAGKAAGGVVMPLPRMTADLGGVRK